MHRNVNDQTDVPLRSMILKLQELNVRLSHEAKSFKISAKRSASEMKTFHFCPLVLANDTVVLWRVAMVHTMTDQ